MADKVVSGIGRELRYFEYKLRKKQQSSKKNKKDKNGNPHQELAWTDTARPDNFNTTSEELRKAAPGSRGEEELQIQVALAMSREEEQERTRQSESDKVRLEMAIKESVKESAPQNQAASKPSLLDLSMSAPKPAAPTSNSLFGATVDPWGASAAPVSTATTFDPFASQPQQQQQPTAPVVTSNNFAAGNDAWGAAPPAPAQANDLWGASTAQAFNPPAPQMNPFPSSQASNPWNTPAPAPQPFPAQSQPWGTNGMAPTTQSTFSAPQTGAWGSTNPDPFGSTQQQTAPTTTYDPFSGTFTPAQPQPNIGMPVMSSAPQNQNAFGMQTSANFSTQPLDPLKDFDNLHIGTGTMTNGNTGPEPVLIQGDYNSGKSVAKDIFPLNQVLEPVQVNAVKTSGEATALPPARTRETDLFLGENSGLVNLDSGWKTYQVPYCTKPLGAASHNPFQQTGPSKTLNEMMKQPGF